MQKKWQIAEACPADFPSAVGASPTVAQLLWNRGLRTPNQVREFLNVQWDGGVHDPRQFRHMEGALARIFDAFKNGDRITVHGDYDADGITGSTLLITVLRELEGKFSVVPAEAGTRPSNPGLDSRLRGNDNRDSLIDFYIPHRDKEGYGLHRETVSLLKERGTKLIVTVDCGIACVDEIALARTSGMDVIVVDHHQFGDKLPDGFLIHPGLPEETYPFKKLAAVGVSYKFACALLDEARRRGFEIQEGWEKWLLDLVAIATVTDVVPLIGENRVLETYGLRVLNKTRRIGLRLLIESAGLQPGALDTESVGFSIGPRLNAAGRMDHASLALRLLLAESEDEARGLVLELERFNRLRQEATREMISQAEEKLSVEAPVIFLWDKRWSPALVGLAAGKFMDRYARPTVVVGHHGGRWIGSGRSIQAYDITAAMRESGEGILTRVGGHAQACGFALEREDKLTDLAARVTQHASGKLKDEDMVPSIPVDAEIPLSAVTDALANELAALEPFGEGNRRPVFLSRACLVVGVDTMGATKNHLRLIVLTSNGRRLKFVGFKAGERAKEVMVGQAVDLVYHIAVNEWQGRKTVEGRIIDFLCI